jgi:hypothetical protein
LAIPRELLLKASVPQWRWTEQHADQTAVLARQTRRGNTAIMILTPAVRSAERLAYLEGMASGAKSSSWESVTLKFVGIGELRNLKLPWAKYPSFRLQLTLRIRTNQPCYVHFSNI